MSDSYIASQGEKVSLKRSQTKNCLITMSTAQIVTVKNIFNLYPHQARERTTIVTIPKLVEFAKPKPNLDLHFKSIHSQWNPQQKRSPRNAHK